MTAKKATKLSSRNVMNDRTAELFTDDTLRDRIARAVCAAGCLPRKEFYEAWEVARRVRRRMRGGRVYDLAAGHGLLAAILLILDDSSPTAVCVDVRKPASFERVHAAILAVWPRLAGRIAYLEQDLGLVAPKTTDLVVSVHACRELTDRILDIAVAASCRVAVLPCCHDTKRSEVGPYGAWMDCSLAIDVGRVVRLEAAGFDVVAQQIPAAITPKNRLLLAQPKALKAAKTSRNQTESAL